MTSAVIQTPVVQAPVRTPAPGDWNTLQILKASRAFLLALTALLLLAVVEGTQVHRDAMQVVGKNTAPSIIAAQHIKAALADMDANAADELLTPAGTSSNASAVFDRRRIEASEALIDAARNITYDAEKAPIETLQVSTGTYERLVQQARDLQDEGQPDAAVRFYRASAILMDGTLLPAADDLDRANNKVLESTYKSEEGHSLAWRLLALACGLLALGALVWAQMFLSRRMKRTLNPLLAVATLATLWLVMHAFAAMGTEEQQLKVADQDAFASVHALWRARAEGYSANAEGSRSLLDPLHAGEYQAAYLAKADELARIPQSTPVAEVLAAAQRGAPTPGFTGYLADELNNITFSGERDAAARTLAAWESYTSIDADIRRLETSGQHQKAVELCIGDSPGQSDWAFNQFDQALLATLDINQRAFDAAVDQGFSALKSLEIEAVVIAAVVAVLIFLGFKGRIREYE
jgi:hypothetical protein